VISRELYFLPRESTVVAKSNSGAFSSKMPRALAVPAELRPPANKQIPCKYLLNELVKKLDASNYLKSF
jgi:hypothetical protein